MIEFERMNDIWAAAADLGRLVADRSFFQSQIAAAEAELAAIPTTIRVRCEGWSHIIRRTPDSSLDLADHDRPGVQDDARMTAALRGGWCRCDRVREAWNKGVRRNLPPDLVRVRRLADHLDNFRSALQEVQDKIDGLVANLIEAITELSGSGR